MKYLVLLLAFVGCTHAPSRENASTSAEEKFCSDLPGGEMLGPIVKKDATSADFCPKSEMGETCLMQRNDALKFCRSKAVRLPTSRDFVCLLPPRGTIAKEVADTPKPIPPGFYLVDSVNPDGSKDQFYLNHDAFQRPMGETEDHSIWTASSPPDHPGYAHVYFDKWGGGGLDPHFPNGEDHKYDHFNSVQCVVKIEK